MELEVDIDENDPYEFRDKFAKVVVGALVGFIAERLVVKAYDAVIIARRSK